MKMNRNLYNAPTPRQVNEFEVLSGTTGKDMTAQIDDPKNPLPSKPVRRGTTETLAGLRKTKNW